MITARDVVLHQFGQGQYVIEKMISDLTEAEFFRPAAPGTNHVAWLLGHIACTEDWAVSMALGRSKQLPATAHERFRGGAPCHPDSGSYPKVADIKAMFQSTRVETVAALKNFDLERWNDPPPPAAPPTLFPRLGAIWQVMGTHQFWHIGQIGTCRAAMGKKTVLL